MNFGDGVPRTCAGSIQPMVRSLRTVGRIDPAHGRGTQSPKFIFFIRFSYFFSFHSARGCFRALAFALALKLPRASVDA